MKANIFRSPYISNIYMFDSQSAAFQLMHGNAVWFPKILRLKMSHLTTSDGFALGILQGRERDRWGRYLYEKIIYGTSLPNWYASIKTNRTENLGLPGLQVFYLSNKQTHLVMFNCCIKNNRRLNAEACKQISIPVLEISLRKESLWQAMINGLDNL